MSSFTQTKALFTGCLGDVNGRTRFSESGGTITGSGQASSTGVAGQPSGNPNSSSVAPFEAVAPAVYTLKVKNLLTGSPASANEIAAVVTDANALRSLVIQWMEDPAALDKLQAFFQTAFQQTQISQTDFEDQGMLNTGDFNLMMLSQNLQEGMARTAVAITQANQPFTNTVTTHQFMRTTAMMAFYTYIGSGTSALAPTFYADYVAPSVGTAISVQDSLDPNSANYMHFSVAAPFDCYVPNLDTTGHVVVVNGKAQATHYTYNERIFDSNPRRWLFGLLVAGRITYGSGRHVLATYENIVIPSDVAPADRHLYATACAAGLSTQPLVQSSDHTDWRLVSVRAPNSNEISTPFYDIPALRTQNELVSHTPRVGFMTHPAFFANYPTNQSNDERDIANQALIVALGRSINPTDKGAVTVLDTGTDGEHSNPTSACFSCQATLDPMRLVVTRNWTYGYNLQTSATSLAEKPVFSFDGVTTPIATNDDWAQVLVSHPLYAGSWVQKLCYYANSAPCSPDDPEFLRIQQIFISSNYNFRTLVTEVMSSPITTGESETKTWQDNGETVSIARYNHLCHTLNRRLQLNVDICSGNAPAGIDAASRTFAATQAASVAANISADGYTRGAESPVLALQPGMFYRSAAESLCEIAASFVVDQPSSIYQSSRQADALTGFVNDIMGLQATDPRAAQARAVLDAHMAEALKAGASATVALRSAFVVACLSPSFLAIGL